MEREKSQEFPVYQLLPVGRENAVSPDVLVNLLGLKSRRALRKEIETERRNGAVILCDRVDGGYFLADTKSAEGCEDLRHYVSAMRMSAQTTIDSIAAAERLLAEIEEA